jgi:hypothetical protein
MVKYNTHSSVSSPFSNYYFRVAAGLSRSAQRDELVLHVGRLSKLLISRNSGWRPNLQAAGLVILFSFAMLLAQDSPKENYAAEKNL